MSDLIDRQAAIDDIWTVSPLASLDREWIDRWLRQLPSANNSEIPNSSDTISRTAAIEAMYSQREKSGNIWVRTAITNCVEAIEQLPPAQPEQPEPDQNGDLWINVPDIDKVTRIYVQESKSKFCRIFYEERI